VKQGEAAGMPCLDRSAAAWAPRHQRCMNVAASSSLERKAWKQDRFKSLRRAPSPQATARRPTKNSSSGSLQASRSAAAVTSTVLPSTARPAPSCWAASAAAAAAASL